VMSVCVFVCVCVCLPVCGHIFSTTHPIFTFLCVLPLAMARSSSGSIVIRYLLKARLLDVTAQLKHSAQAALGLAINSVQ